MGKIHTKCVWIGKSTKYIAIEAEWKLNEDEKGPTILKIEVVKVIKHMRRKNATAVYSPKEMGDGGLWWLLKCK